MAGIQKAVTIDNLSYHEILVLNMKTRTIAVGSWIDKADKEAGTPARDKTVINIEDDFFTDQGIIDGTSALFGYVMSKSSKFAGGSVSA